MTTEETIAALDRGDVRVAEKIDGEWRVNEDAEYHEQGDRAQETGASGLRSVPRRLSA